MEGGVSCLCHLTHRHMSLHTCALLPVRNPDSCSGGEALPHPTPPRKPKPQEISALLPHPGCRATTKIVASGPQITSVSKPAVPRGWALSRCQALMRKLFSHQGPSPPRGMSFHCCGVEGPTCTAQSHLYPRPCRTQPQRPGRVQGEHCSSPLHLNLTKAPIPSSHGGKQTPCLPSPSSPPGSMGIRICGSRAAEGRWLSRQALRASHHESPPPGPLERSGPCPTPSL